MSITAPAPASAEPAAGGAPAIPREGCPLCGTPLHPEQEWCLHCGAAARTRLAPSPGWRGPIVALVVVLVLCLGVLTGSLVKLAGGTPTGATQTTTVTTRATATNTYPNGFLPGTASTLATTPTAPTQPTFPNTTATTTPNNPNGAATSPLSQLGKAKGKVKGPVGGINLQRLKKTLAERIRKAEHTER